MSLGLPSHLARVTLSNSFGKALHAVAFAALLCAGLVVLSYMSARPDLVLWPAMGAIAFMGFALWLNDRFATVLFDISYLAVGCASVYWYSLTLQTQLPELVASDAIWLALPKIALVMVAGAGAGPAAALAWCVMGYVSAEIVSAVATVQTRNDVELDAPTLVAFLLAVATVGLSEIARFRARKTQPRLHRAAREERLAALRARTELKAAAFLHDTVLSHLAAIAHSPGKELSPELEIQIVRDLQVLVGEEWLSEPVSTVSAKDATDWRQSALQAAIQEARLQGLEVENTGDLSAVARLDKTLANALGLAVKQCLTNVIKHSGTMKAEVAVYGSDTDVSVMVIDMGSGFSIDTVGPDRLGLRASVRRRMEAVGGTVQVWSTPGTGTSILIQLPTQVSLKSSALAGARAASEDALNEIQSSATPGEPG